jgi:hypothetical protein
VAGASPAPTDVPLLRGLFGVLQAGAQQRQSTAEIWQGLRQAAGTWQFQAQGVQQPYDPAAVEEAGRAILSAQGIRGDTVSTFRGVAGQWLGAKQQLAALGEGAQITASAIFVPPWATSASAAVPDRWRIRTQWQITPTIGESFSVWKSDELTGPLTTTADTLSEAEPAANTQSGQRILSGGEPPVLTDFEIEQI